MLVINKSTLKLASYRCCALWLIALVAIGFIDKPLALYMHSAGWDQLIWLRHISRGLLQPLLILTMLILFAYELRPRLLGGVLLVAYFYAGLKLTLAIKVGLKIVFGRYWPNTWIKNNLSLIHDGVYGFNWWHGFGDQGSLPSGHAVLVIFCCTWLYLVMPRLRYLLASIAAVSILPMIILNTHFLGDCLAGIGLGYWCAVMLAFIWQNVLRPYVYVIKVGKKSVN